MDQLPPDAPPVLKDYIVTPDAAPEDIAPTQAEQLRAYLNSNLFAFCWVIFGYQDIIPSLHGQLCAYIQQWGKPGYKRLMVQMPREHFKTSVGTRANALWQIVREPHLPVAIFNERDENARKWLGSIRDVVQGSKLFQAIYKDLLPPGVSWDDTRSTPRWWKWSDQRLDFEGRPLGEAEGSITAHGIEAATTGGHWPKLILDDLISVKHKLSETEMERAREWVRNHVYLMRPAEEGLCFAICTPWTYSDIYVDLARDFEYLLYRRSALETSEGESSVLGESIFPEKLDTAALLKMHDRDQYTFMSQMQCQPRPGREQSFDVDWIRSFNCDPYDTDPVISIERESYDPDIGKEDYEGAASPPRTIPLSMCEKALILDPAPSEGRDKKAEPGARNGIVVRAVDPWGRRYLLESWAERADYYDVIRQMFHFSEKWGLDVGFVEEVVFSNVYRHWIQRLTDPGQEYSQSTFRITPVKPGKQIKNVRILSSTPDWREGFNYVNRVRSSTKLGEGWNEKFILEYAEYPNGLTVDLLDADSYQSKIRIPETSERRLMREAQERGGGRYPYGTRCPVTGYLLPPIVYLATLGETILEVARWGLFS